MKRPTRRQSTNKAREEAATSPGRFRTASTDFRTRFRTASTDFRTRLARRRTCGELASTEEQIFSVDTPPGRNASRRLSGRADSTSAASPHNQLDRRPLGLPRNPGAREVAAGLVQTAVRANAACWVSCCHTVGVTAPCCTAELLEHVNMSVIPFVGVARSGEAPTRFWRC